MSTATQYWVIANWKSHKTTTDVSAWLTKLPSLSVPAQTTAIIAPPFPYLGHVAEAIQNQPTVSLGAQDVSPYPMGSYTGAVNAKMLHDVGVKYVVVGHSERRRYFHETHLDVAQKVDQALQNNITPVVCVDVEYIEAQFQAIAPDQASQCLVAYEPLAAIGTGRNEPVDHVAEVAERIKQLFGAVPVLYGGSVSGANAREYTLVSQGFIVGGASLKMAEFSTIVAATQPLK